MRTVESDAGLDRFHSPKKDRPYCDPDQLPYQREPTLSSAGLLSKLSHSTKNRKSAVLVPDLVSLVSFSLET